MTFREQKVNSLLKNLVADFCAKETAGSIITVTRVEITKDLKSAKIFISIFPENKKNEVLGVLEEKKGELRKYIGSRIKMKFLPRLEIEIDKEEATRKKIDELLGLVAKW